VANTITNVLGKILADGVLALRQNAVTPRLVNRDYEGAAVAGAGAAVNVPIPSSIAARAVTPSVVMNSNVASSPTVAVLTLDHWYEAPFEVTDQERVEMDPTFFPMQASEAIKSLANDADAFLLGKHIGIYSFAGAAGTTPFNGSLVAASTARKLLNKQLAPMEQRFGMLDPDAEALFGINANIIQADQRGDQDGIIRGVIGQKLGIDWYMNQNISSFTPGTAWVTGFSVVTAGIAAGAQTMTLVNATASGIVKIGDLFTVGGSSQQYVITAQVTVTSSSGAGTHNTYTFYPALATAAVSGAAATVVATAYVANIVANRYAFAFASRPFRDTLVDGHVFQAPLDPISGIALRLEISRQYKLESLSYDYLAGAALIRRELATKILG
jgi:hypothetical protein